jgi:hypothetical protein
MTADELVKNFTRIPKIGRRKQVCNRHLDLFKLLCAKIVMLRFRRKKMQTHAAFSAPFYEQQAVLEIQRDPVIFEQVSAQP